MQLFRRLLTFFFATVKSVDLDTWTDEQLQSMLKWGNIKANKYEDHDHFCVQLLMIRLGIGRRTLHQDMCRQKRM